MISRFVFIRGVFVAAILSLAALIAPARAQVPFIGTPSATSKIGYLVLDFNDLTPNPEVYGFGYNYEGTKTNADFILGLESALGGPTRPNGFQQTGAANNFVTKLGYNGRSKFNDFAGNNSGENGYWNLWLSFDGIAWTSAQFGAKDITLSDTPLYTFSSFNGKNELSGAKYHGWRWVPTFSATPLAPRTPLAIVAAPEPGTLALALVGAGTAAVVTRRRNRRTA